MSKKNNSPIPTMTSRIEELEKELAEVKRQLEWYKLYADQVEMSNYKAHEYACEYADEETGVIDYPYAEGDDYWTVEELGDEEYDDSTGCYNHGILAVQSCWDEQSEELHKENPNQEYFDSLEEVLQFARYEYDYIKVSCYASGMDDIEDGDVFVTTDTNDCDKYQKSY